jgi:apolipoprotein N-acyltransferase
VGKKLLGVAARLGGLALSGMLFMLAMPPSGMHALGWVCMVPALLAVRKTRFSFGFLGGMALLLLAGYLTATGIFYPTKWFEGSTGWNYLGFAIFGVAVGGVLSIYSEKKLESLRVAVYLAAAGVLGEGVLLLKLPAHIALTQFNNWPVVQLAGIGGIWLVSYLVWLSNLFIAEAIALKKYKALGAAAAGVVVITCLGIPAVARPIRDALYRPVELKAVSVALIQTQAGDIGSLGKLNLEAGKKGAELAVWPELSAIGIAMGGDTEDLVKLAREPGQIPFVTTFVAPDPKGGMPFNMASLFSKAGESERYAKRKPFGAEANEHQAGQKPLIQTAQLNDYGPINLGFTICFDTCFPFITNELARSGDIDLIVCPTLDPMAPHGSIQSIHAAYMPFRSSELGLPIARAEMSGWSMMTDNTGWITKVGGAGTEEVIIAPVQAFARGRIAKTLGDWWMIVCFLIIGVGLVESYRLGRAEAQKARLS